MKEVIIIFFLAITNCAYGQNEALDKKGGFKNFKIGDDKSKFITNLKVIPGSNSELTSYKYIPNDKSEFRVFGIMFDGIMLGFSKENKLTSFFLVKDYDNSNFKNGLENYSSILFELHNLFDKPTKDISDESKSLTEYYWEGNKISLYLTHTYKGIIDGSIISIMILDNAIDSKNHDF